MCRDPPYLEKAVKGSNAFKAFGVAGDNGGKPAAFARGAHEAIAGPGAFTLAAIPFNDETEGKDIEVTCKQDIKSTVGGQDEFVFCCVLCVCVMCGVQSRCLPAGSRARSSSRAASDELIGCC